jgi:hypothetical protein
LSPHESGCESIRPIRKIGARIPLASIEARQLASIDKIETDRETKGILEGQGSAGKVSICVKRRAIKLSASDGIVGRIRPRRIGDFQICASRRIRIIEPRDVIRGILQNVCLRSGLKKPVGDPVIVREGTTPKIRLCAGVRNAKPKRGKAA